MNDATLAEACDALARGGLIAYPTEAVYGLGCDPAAEAAVNRLLALKKRSVGKGLILIASNFSQLVPWIETPDAEVRARIMSTWPGPVTWLLPAAADCPRWLRGVHDTIAVRVTDHPVAAALCRAWGGALVSTSANRAGEPPLTDAAGVRAAFGDAVDIVIGGETGGRARPTPIRDARTNRVIRE